MLVYSQYSNNKQEQCVFVSIFAHIEVQEKINKMNQPLLFANRILISYQHILSVLHNPLSRYINLYMSE